MEKKWTNIPLEGACNTRDLGGIETLDGRTIKKHRLLRSGELIGLTEKDRDLLTGEYGLRAIIDFRTERERFQRPDPLMEEVEMIWNPILEEKSLGITREDGDQVSAVEGLMEALKNGGGNAEQHMGRIYENIARKPFSVRQYGKFFEYLMKDYNGAVLWHCSAGKDRVGTGTALLLSVLGVPEETVIHDYMMTNIFAEQGIKRDMDRMIPADVDLKIREALRPLFMVKESYLNSVFAYMKEQEGSLEKFIEKNMGIGAAQKKQLQTLYLE